LHDIHDVYVIFISENILPSNKKNAKERLSVEEEEILISQGET